MPRSSRRARGAAPARGRALVVAALCAGALPAGCASGALDARVIELEAAVLRLERRIDGLTGLGARVQALEVIAARPPAGDADLDARLAGLDARDMDHDDRLLALERARRLSIGEPDAGAPGAAGPAAGEPARGPAWIDRAGGGPAGPPPADVPLEVLSCGAGDLLLVRGPAGLARVALLGVEAPARADAYAANAALRGRHAGLLGAPSTTSDEAFERSMAHLVRLVVAAGRVRLRYPAPGTPGSSAAGRPGVALAYVEVDGPQGAFDVGAAMLRDGFALASTDPHPRAADYQALEAGARAARRGLLTGP